MIFSYKARNQQGEFINGKINAADKRTAAMAVRQQGLYILTIKPVITASSLKSHWQKNIEYGWKVKITAVELGLFFRQAAVMTEAGLNIYDILTSLKAQSKKNMQQVLNDLANAILNGKTLSSAMAMQEAVFSPLIRTVVAAGEASGSLDKAFAELADFLEQSQRAKAKLKTALIYPAILLLAVLLALLFMTLFVLPAFSVMLKNLNTELPWLTKVILGFTDFFASYTKEILFMLVFLLVGFGCSMRLAKVRFYSDWLSLHIPFWGKLAIYADWYMLFTVLAMLQKNGILLAKALAMSALASGNTYLQFRFTKVKEAIERGESLTDALGQIKEFPISLLSMIKAGEITGNLDDMLLRAARFCQFNAMRLSEQFLAMVEPAAITLVGLIVGTLVLAIIMPLFSAMDALL